MAKFLCGKIGNQKKDSEQYDSEDANSILRSITSAKLLASSLNKYDLRRFNEDYRKTLIDIHHQVGVRHERLTSLLKSFVCQHKIRFYINSAMKITVFLVLLIIITKFSKLLFTLINDFDFNSIGTEAVIALITVAVTYIGSFIGTFEIIANHLFPENEESESAELLKTVISNDSSAEGFAADYAMSIDKNSHDTSDK